MSRAPQLTETAPQILHSKGCFALFCEAVWKIRTFALMCRFSKLTVALGAGGRRCPLRCCPPGFLKEKHSALEDAQDFERNQK
jgi:hypothetical protein